MIRLVDVSKVYRNAGIETIALTGINLEIASGELVAIMGPSGSGKSTLLNLIGLLDVPSAGRLFIEDEAVATQSDKELARRRNQTFGFVFQSYHLIPDLKVVDNVELPLL